MSDLERHFIRLMNFARQHNFHKPFSEVYFAEDKSIQRSSRTDEINEISQQNIFNLANYEIRFNEVLNQRHSWININFAGMLNDSLLIIIEVPNYENNAEFTEVNLSLPDRKVMENDWNISSLYKIV
jgi:hypothetical protein